MQIFPSADPLLDIDLGVRALVVAADPIVRESFLAKIADMTAASSSDTDVADVLARGEANIVLWDLGPEPWGDGRPPWANVDRSETPIIALSSEPGRALELIEQGASGVLRRSSTGAMLRAAMESVLAGLAVISPDLLRDEPREPSVDPRISSTEPGPITRVDPSSANGTAELTAREHEVLEGLAAGLSNKRIAALLGISTHTAKFHIGAILAKLDAGTRTEAVVRAVQQGLVLL